VGKSTIARILAKRFAPCAVIEVDDVRRMVVSGAAAPWEAGEGARQTELAALHTGMLMGSFVGAGFGVVATDVLLAGAGSVYAAGPAPPLVVHLGVTLDEARRRAATRAVHLTDREFLRLYDLERGAEHAHVRIDATALGLDALTAAVIEAWTGGGGRPAVGPQR
jgi:hypothetical protein